MLPLYDTIPARRPAIAVWLLIAVNVLVLLAELGLTAPALDAAIAGLAVVPARFLTAWVGGQVPPLWTLVTCVFLHAGLFHLVANLWVLGIFGDNVEDRMGPMRFVLFYLLCGAAARLLGLAVSEDMPEEFMRLMALYPQPKRGNASVEFVPAPYRKPEPR